jgi:hypothetical protein
MRLLCSGVSMRRSASLLKIHYMTVAKKLEFLAGQAALDHQKKLRHSLTRSPLSNVQFDEMESSIHTKCKPVSIALMVDEKTRKILEFRVSQMPATGHLAKISRRKYGPRKDEREKGLRDLLSSVQALVSESASIRTDSKTLYGPLVKEYFPRATHDTVKGKRGSTTGQGELKKVVFDPLFSLNHTCAMFRANVNRLFRRTWCISKTIEGLTRHLQLYVNYHNQVLTC